MKRWWLNPLEHGTVGRGSRDSKVKRCEQDLSSLKSVFAGGGRSDPNTLH